MTHPAALRCGRTMPAFLVKVERDPARLLQARAMLQEHDGQSNSLPMVLHPVGKTPLLVMTVVRSATSAKDEKVGSSKDRVDVLRNVNRD
jgi:hypothetical protein